VAQVAADEAKARQTASQQVRQPTVIDGNDIWARLRQCEAGGDYNKNTGNGFYGAYQFTIPTWNNMQTGYSRADLAPPNVQDSAAMRLQSQSGWGQWPACSSRLGLN
jgi:hypothetical protein